MSVLKKLRNDYVIWHANRVKLPERTPGNIVRKKLFFPVRCRR